MNPNYPPYPSQQMPGAQPYPLYPTTNSQTPNTMPTPYSTQPGFNMSGYPPAGGYPPQPTGYPPKPECYPSQSGSYPQQPGYPPSQPGYPPSQPSYPPHQPSAYPTPSSYNPQSAYPQSQPVYPLNSNSSYPGAHPQTNTAHAYAPAYGYTQPASVHQTVGHQVQLCPTVRPMTPFDARQDAEILRKAMKGLGTDEKAIINVLTRRSNNQRQEIAVQFKAMYGKDLIGDLKGELSGKFEDLVIALMTPLTVFLAKELQYAIEGIGTNEQTLIEILCTATNSEIFAIKDAYTRVFGRSLENDLCGDTSGHFKRLLVSVVQGRRSQDTMIDEAAAVRDAQALMAAGVMMWGTDESTFNAILCTRSYPQLRCILTQYQRLSGHPLEEAIRTEFSGDIQDGLLAIVQCVLDKAGYFACRLRDAVACAGTKDRQLIRVVVSRCEIDMQNIKQAYQQRYGKSVEQDISDDTSGDYKKALLALVSGY